MRSKSTHRGAETLETLSGRSPSFHNLGMIHKRHGSLGPSMLLKNSGSNHALPRMGDYHQNLTKLHKYTAAGPGDYNLPQLFDNYKKTTDAQNALVKKNP